MTDQLEYLYGIPVTKLPSYRVAEPVGTKPVPERDSINYELLDEILKFIQDHPRTWIQDSWYKHVDTHTGEKIITVRTEEVEDADSCGTSFCFAGHTALHEGFPNPPKDDTLNWTRKVDGEVFDEDVSEFAQKVLGLSYDQADSLFHPDNSLENLETMVQALHEFPNIVGWRLDDIRTENLNIESVRAGVQDDPEYWLNK